jgi:cation transport ATPase
MKYSKFGFVLSGLYLIITSVIFYQAFTCGEMFCGLMAILPVLPWTFVMEAIPGFKFLDNQFGLYFFALVNLLILYLLGSVLERWYKKASSK